MSRVSRVPMEPAIRASITVPPGTYVVGDPCYSIPDRSWMTWLEAADYETNDRRHVLAAAIDGYVAVGVSTAFGDGVYRGSDGHEYGVDAGLLGLVPVEVAKDVEHNVELGLVTVQFLPLPTECHYDDGTVHLGGLRIYTGDEEGD